MSNVNSKTQYKKFRSDGLPNRDKTGARIMVASFKLANVYPETESQTKR